MKIFLVTYSLEDGIFRDREFFDFSKALEFACSHFRGFESEAFDVIFSCGSSFTRLSLIDEVKDIIIHLDKEGS